jgi:hypothetical protein
VASEGPNSLSTYTRNADGTLSQVDSVATGQAATCWVAVAHGFFYKCNAGSGSLSGFQDNVEGQFSLLAQTATNPGTVDAAATNDGQGFYVETGKAGNVDEFRVAADGSLSPSGSVIVPGAAGGEGIVAVWPLTTRPLPGWF